MSLNIALIGYGRMGKEIAHHAKDRGHRIISTFDINHPLSASAIDSKTDVFIDFSIPVAVLPNLEIIASSGKPVVIGTTGWYEHLNQVQALVEKANIALIYASNFSLGMNIFFKIVEDASSLFNKFDDYDPFIHEIHHRMKIDSPSGTGRLLGTILLGKIKRKNQLFFERSEGQILPNMLHVTSTRSGNVPGTHVVGFDSAADTIELKHTARNRSGFARGALYAAEWIINKKGLFSLNDMLKEIFE